MQRRSRTSRTPRKRYTVDAFEGIEELQHEANSDADPKSVDGNGSGDEFRHDADQSADEDEMSGIGNGANNDDASFADDAGDHLLDEMMLDDDNDSELDLDEPLSRTVSKKPSSSKRKRQDNRDRIAYTRGVPESLHTIRSLGSWGRDARWLFYLGSDQADVSPMFRAKRKWAYDPTLPSRVADSNGTGGFHESFYLDDVARVVHIERNARWLSENGAQHYVDTTQKSEKIDPVRAREYIQGRQTSKSCAVVMGPFKKQKLYHISPLDHLRLADVWRSNSPDIAVDKVKDGFLLNAGGRVQCVDWAANHSENSQYIAVAILPQRTAWQSETDSLSAPAFTAGPPYRSSFQIWKVVSTADGRIDGQIAPQQVLVVCTEWGAARQLKWCSAPCKLPEVSSGKRLGLLAGLWTDGAVRILDIVLPLQPESGTSYVRIKEPVFCARAPNIVFSCVAWIGSNRLAAGCANGYVAVWDLTTSFQHGSNARPMLYTSVSTTYIASITSCFPSRPNILVSSSMSGFLSMTDISRTGQSIFSTNTTWSSRIRIIQPTLLWHDFAQVVLNTEDNFQLRGSPIRRFFANIGLGKYKSHATCIAGSPVHPFVLSGTSSGEVVSLNPLNRIVDGKSPVLQQTWFSHEWRRPNVEEAASAEGLGDTGAADITAQGEAHIGQHGLTRVLEGQKIERVMLSHEARNASNHPDGGTFTTIYEENSAITAVAWNPNIHVGGWAAAGCADGLLRLEDLAV